MAEERWHSVDLLAEMLLEQLERHHRSEVRAVRIRPSMTRIAERLPRIGGTPGASKADRLLNRFWVYPRRLRGEARELDLFHLVEHSYGQLVRELPAERTVVTCHDLDTFRCLLQPEREPRPGWYRAMAERQMTGIRTAARVVCVSHTVADELRGFGIVPPERIRVVPNGIDPACSPLPRPNVDAEAARLLGPADPEAVELLHVGSTVPRKRIDVLLRVLAAVRGELPRARLLRVGGPLTGEQAEMAAALGVEGAVVTLPFLDRARLAAVYRRAVLVLQTSEAEGFGLPVAEAMACGTPVVASDIPVLREVGGDAAIYAPVADVPAWTRTVLDLLAERRAEPERWAARTRASAARGGSFSWAENARSMVAIYGELLGR
jgi:glycosyltransferase involved in cell wall biosynthesis